MGVDCNGWILTMAGLAARGMKLDPLCPICSNCVESMMHALWHCSNLKCIWSASCITGNSNGLDSIPFLDFVLSCKDRAGPRDFKNLCVTWWRIWFRRNQMVHSSVLSPAIEVVEWADNYLSVFRESAGICYKPNFAEALAILRGLHLALENGLFPTSLESDALVVVDMIGSTVPPSSEIGVIIHDILVFFWNSHFLAINFVPRLANKVAHGLAKLALNHVGEFVWLDDCPLSVESLVLGDSPSSL
ncbi:hypothetical protein Q3G72_021713 [Acer saccharum]|nr:hypothetical protein Q3G72_021713 [Acer saccharum]